MYRQDKQGVRRPAELEQKYNFDKRFNDAMSAAEDAKKVAEDLDKNLDQAAIFNRLTNYGKAQGLYRDEEGNLYINASFLATGILKSKDGETFYLDLDKGILKGQFSEFSISGKTVESIAQKEAKKYANSAVNGQSQEDVFNKLTANGTAQGLFYQNGQLYINASYLVAGILKTLDSTTFCLDLTNSVLQILGKTVSWKENEDGTYTLVGK